MLTDMTTRTMVLILALLATLVGVAVADGPPRPEEQVLRQVNAYRAAAGLPPVILDAKLSRGCAEHARYMALNRDTEAMAGLNAHHQRPELPGASPAGAACGVAADLFPGVSDLKTAVDAWMASLYHRRPVLTPSLAKIGVGYDPLPDGSLMAALMFVDGPSDDAEPFAVRYPADGQRDVPLEFGFEIPNPIPHNGRGGYPITVQFPAFDKVTEVTATLVDGAGHPVPFYLSDPEHPATSFGQYGVVCLIPKAPLAPSARYVATVEATWRGKPGRWQTRFATLGLRVIDPITEDALAAAVGVASLVRGTVVHAGVIGGGTRFLQLGAPKGGRYKLVSVMIPAEVWAALGGGNPLAWKGRSIAVAATPMVVGSEYLNLPISAASQVTAQATPDTP
jgi:hypothetical protein